MLAAAAIQGSRFPAVDQHRIAEERPDLGRRNHDAHRRGPVDQHQQRKKTWSVPYPRKGPGRPRGKSRSRPLPPLPGESAAGSTPRWREQPHTKMRRRHRRPVPPSAAGGGRVHRSADRPPPVPATARAGRPSSLAVPPRYWCANRRPASADRAGTCPEKAVRTRTAPQGRSPSISCVFAKLSEKRLPRRLADRS